MYSEGREHFPVCSERSGTVFSILKTIRNWAIQLSESKATSVKTRARNDESAAYERVIAITDKSEVQEV